MNKGIILSLNILIGLLLFGSLITFIVEIFMTPLTATPPKHIAKIKRIIALNSNETIADFGSGTGVFLLAICTNGKKGIGFEIAPIMGLMSRLNILYHKLFRRQKFDIQIIAESCLAQDLNQFDVVYCNLSPKLMQLLQSTIVQKLQLDNHNIPQKHVKKTRLYSYQNRFSNIPVLQKHKLTETISLFEYQI